MGTWLRRWIAGPLFQRDARVVELAPVAGIPQFLQVLEVVLAEIVVERSVAAQESEGTVVADGLVQCGLAPDLISHDEPAPPPTPRRVKR